MLSIIGPPCPPPPQYANDLYNYVVVLGYPMAVSFSMFTAASHTAVRVVECNLNPCNYQFCHI